MPKALSVDWDSLKTAYVKGVPLPELAKQAGVSYTALRARAHRHNWKAAATAGAAMLQQSVTMSLAERGRVWEGRVASLMEKRLAYLETLDPAVLSLKELRELTEITDTTDKIARRTYQLDDERNRPRASSLICVQMNTGSSDMALNIPPVDFPSVEIFDEV